MKNTLNLIAVIGLVIFAICSQGKGQVPPSENGDSVSQQKSDLKKDSAATFKEPTSEDLDNLDVKMAEKLTALKYDASTKQLKVSYGFDNTGSMVKITLYYQENRLIRIEKYIYDQSNKALSYSMFNFDENNGCFSNVQWNVKDANKLVLTTSEYGLIYFGSNMKLIKLKPNQMQKYLQETKDSLDAVMKHFKDFKYTFEIK